MKSLLPLIYIICFHIIFLSACTDKRHQLHSELFYIESLSDEKPDSAAMLLHQFAVENRGLSQADEAPLHHRGRGGSSPRKRHRISHTDYQVFASTILIIQPRLHKSKLMTYFKTKLNIYFSKHITLYIVAILKKYSQSNLFSK